MYLLFNCCFNYFPALKAVTIYYKVKAGLAYYIKVQAVERNHPEGDFDYVLRAYEEGKY
ncbi:hypothetical protein SZ39_1023 [Bacillus mycoides]|nr:hypothetical protein SZ39_1023 [Bacillus mycoides]